MQNKSFYPRIITLLTLACLSHAVYAENIALQADHPQRYVVKKGDTLWSISSKFLKNPWQWSKVWKMNRNEIKKPHWIYPGDTIVLNMVNNQPEFALERGTVTLNPDVRIEELGAKEGIKAIPPSVIGPFLSQPLLIENDQLDKAPRIIAGQEGRVILSPGTRVYVDRIKEGSPIHWDVYRAGEPLVDPETEKVLGTEAIYLGEMNVARFGEPATGDIVRVKEEIFVKDRLIVTPEQFKDNFVPHAPDTAIKGHVLRIYGGVAEAGPNAVVCINRGKADGLEPGHVMGVYRYGKIIQDATKRDDKKLVEAKPKLKELKLDIKTRADGAKEVNLRKDPIKLEPDPQFDEIKLPEERVGLLMVFKTFEHVSYGMVMSTNDSIRALDLVHTP